MMVNPVSGFGIEPTKSPTTAAVKPVLDGHESARFVDARASVGSAAADLARLGPPVDMNRVGEIKAAIAKGTYTLDADRLAVAMLALDLPVCSA